MSDIEEFGALGLVDIRFDGCVPTSVGVVTHELKTKLYLCIIVFIIPASCSYSSSLSFSSISSPRVSGLESQLCLEIMGFPGLDFRARWESAVRRGRSTFGSSKSESERMSMTCVRLGERSSASSLEAARSTMSTNSGMNSSGNEAPGQPGE
jgi:hypothetical protein